MLLLKKTDTGKRFLKKPGFEKKVYLSIFHNLFHEKTDGKEQGCQKIIL